MLKENLFINNITDVQLNQTAISNSESLKDMYIDSTGMDRFSVASFNRDAWNSEVESKEIEVKTERLDKYLKSGVDMLKLDVEGSEQSILLSIKKYFSNIKNIVFEYHPTPNQKLDSILETLEKRYDIEILYEGKILKRNIPKDRLLTIRATYKG
jgi:FkbM family methyltransferase